MFKRYNQQLLFKSPFHFLQLCTFFVIISIIPHNANTWFEHNKAIFCWKPSRLMALLMVRPWLFVHLCCVIAFIVQIAMIAMEYIRPTQTVVSSQIRELGELAELPVVFKVCVDTGVTNEALEAIGYRRKFALFSGRSKFDYDLVGWSGHTRDGGTIGPTAVRGGV